MKTPINLDGFIQIALVVDDIETAAAAWAELFGVEKPAVRDASVESGDSVTYRGQTARYGLKVAHIQAGKFIIELHEPDKRDSTFREFLDKHGNGVHHLGFEVGERRDAVIGELEQKGYAMRQIGFYPGSSWTIVDSENTLGVNLNVKPKA